MFVALVLWMMFPWDLSSNGFLWLMSAICAVIALLALMHASQDHGEALLGLTIGAYVMSSIYCDIVTTHLSMAKSNELVYLVIFPAIMVGFPLGLLIRVWLGNWPPALPEALSFGGLGCLYFPVALAVYAAIGMPGWLLDPMTPWSQFGVLVGAVGYPAAMLNSLGVCIASGLALLLLSWPLFLAIGGITLIRDN